MKKSFIKDARIEGSVTMVVGTDDFVRLGQIDHAERQVVSGQFRKLLQGGFGHPVELGPERCIDRNSPELTVIAAGDQRYQEEEQKETERNIR